MGDNSNESCRVYAHVNQKGSEAGKNIFPQYLYRLIEEQAALLLAAEWQPQTWSVVILLTQGKEYNKELHEFTLVEETI